MNAKASAYMNNFKKTLSVFLFIFTFVTSLFSCAPKEEIETDHDFAAETKLDLSTATLKQTVSVRAYIDGDTTHFNVPYSVSESGVLKARYLAVNTPESTGRIEEWGKNASEFTKSKLLSAESIIIESETEKWNLDSTGGRYLVWVWYRAAKNEDYRNLNIELLQNGLALASSSANNRYGEICMKALHQAKRLKLNVYSGKRDPDFYYGEAIEMTLKELRCNVADYTGKKVAFAGVITRNDRNSVYVEDYDAETGMYFGISVYYGFGLDGEALEIINVGNRSRIVGTVQYYENGDSYQVSGLEYRVMKPDDPDNIRKISDGHSPAYTEISPDTFVNGRVNVTAGGKDKSMPFAELALATSVSMKNLTVKNIYTTENEESSSLGAMTLVCEAGGETVHVRTVPLYDGDRKADKSDFEGKVIDVRGIADRFKGTYQIRVLSFDDIAVH